MPTPLSSSDELALVLELMRSLSLQTDPQKAAQLYADGIRRLNLFPSDRYLSVSRRGLQKPFYRITRNSSWDNQPNPWTQTEKFPLLQGGLLGDAIYSNDIRIIPNLPAVLSPDDPAYESLKDMGFLFAFPHFELGEAINMGVILVKDSATFPMAMVPRIVFDSNLWGRATLNLVNQQKLLAAYNNMDRELQVVADIQRSLLPRILPAIKSAQVAAYYQTSQHAGGDYYDFFPLPNDQWGIFVADVSGHGTPAAVLMAITHAIAHTHPGHPMPAPEVLSFINRQLVAHYTNGNGTFVTAFYGVFDPLHRRLSYSSAGHPAPRLVRGCEILDIDGKTSYPLGISAAEPFLTHTLEMKPNDQVLIYTDGIPDTFNSEGETFGDERLNDACCAAPSPPSPTASRDLIDTILAHLARHAGQTPVTDDRTLVALTVD